MKRSRLYLQVLGLISVVSLGLSACSLSEGVGVLKKAVSPVVESGSFVVDTAPSNFYRIEGKSQFKILDPSSSGIKETYGDLDSLGRPTYAFIRLTVEEFVEEKKIPRKEIKVDPVGWVKPNPRVVLSDGENTYRGYLYNRSHLLADSLGGEPVVENLVTGTRLQNVGWNVKGKEGGMAYGETLASDWLNDFERSLDDFMLYEVVCLYSDDDLVSDAQLVNILSSDGELDISILVFNGTGDATVEYR